MVGIEVPNRAVNTVSLREVIDSKEFHSAKSKSSFSVGKDIGGNCIVGGFSFSVAKKINRKNSF